LEKNKGPSVVLSIPLGLSRFGYFYTNHEFPVAMTIDEISPDEYNQIIKKYPMPADDLTYIYQKFDVQYVVGLKNKLDSYHPLGSKVYENDVVDVYSV
ncbi:hypothetical protein KJ708_09695, partial [bacterium]|nr:hypothetical protein [bacterium]MBU1917404.1 hypothetical protein [bacterium]